MLIFSKSFNIKYKYGMSDSNYKFCNISIKYNKNIIKYNMNIANLFIHAIDIMWKWSDVGRIESHLGISAIPNSWDPKVRLN